MSLAAVDPGIPDCATAVFTDDDRLWFVQNTPPGVLATFGGAVCELPQSDGRSVPTSGLIRLTASGCLCAAGLTRYPVSLVTPSEWKGQTKKPIHHARMWGALTPAERELLGGDTTYRAIQAAKARGAADGWRKKSSAAYYRARELATVDGLRIDHNILDAVALGLWHLGRIDKAGYPK